MSASKQQISSTADNRWYYTSSSFESTMNVMLGKIDSFCEMKSREPKIKNPDWHSNITVLSWESGDIIYLYSSLLESANLARLRFLWYVPQESL